MYRSGHLDKVTWSSPDTWIDLSIARDTDQSWRFWVHIQNLLTKHVWTQVEPSHMEPITFPDFDTYYRSSHIGCYSWNFKFPCPDSESPENLSLDKSCLTQFGAGHNPFLMPIYCFEYSRCYRPNLDLGYWYSESPRKSGLGASWTIQIRGGQISS